MNNTNNLQEFKNIHDTIVTERDILLARINDINNILKDLGVGGKPGRPKKIVGEADKTTEKKTEVEVTQILA